MHRLLPRPAVLLGVLLALALLIPGLWAGMGAGHSAPPAHPAPHANPAPSDAPSNPPVRLLVTTAGLTPEDLDPHLAPTLTCLAERSGLAAMNTTSTTVVSTKRQGLETIRSGYRGLAAQAPASAGIPTPATDQWQNLPEPVRTAPPAQAAAALAEPGMVLVDIGSVPGHDDPSRAQAVSTLDAQLQQLLDPLGGCSAEDLPRLLLVSVAATDPADPAAVERAGAVASRSVGLQLALDTAYPGQALTSGATKQDGIIALTDVLPTVLGSYGAEPTGRVQGQQIVGVTHSDPMQLGRDRAMAARMVDAATVPALLSWMMLGVAGAVLCLVRPLARRSRLLAVGRALAVIGPLCLPVGLLAQVVPWWRTGMPALALTATVWVGSAVLAAVVLAGPWRRLPLGPAGVSAALVAGIILAESAAGSHLQVGSPLGAQPISGGRYYGLSNHLFGLVLAGALMALLALFTVVRGARARVLWTLGVGAVVAGICVAPSMGADFGSMLVTVPVFGLLALMVAGIRLRLWHLLALGVGGAAAVLAVSFADWLRPPASRTHLGGFVDDLLSGELLAVIIRKLAQNVAMTTGYPGLAVLLVVAVIVSVALLWPARLRCARLAALDAQFPVALRVRIALVVGTWAGYAVNDTGPVLVAGVVAVWMFLLPAALPASEGADGSVGAVGSARAHPAATA